MIAAILGMAERLGLETLAEGVESVGEHALLAQLGCGHVQGFGIARPMPADQSRPGSRLATAASPIRPNSTGAAADGWPSHRNLIAELRARERDRTARCRRDWTQGHEKRAKPLDLWCPCLLNPSLTYKGQVQSLMDDQNKNLILATALSFVVILMWFVLFPPPEPEAVDPQRTCRDRRPRAQSPQVATEPSAAPGATTAAPSRRAPSMPRRRASPIETRRLAGSISLTGGRIDDLKLKDYRVTLDPDSPIVQMLGPVRHRQPYYALYGWAPGTALAQTTCRAPNTDWTVESGETLTHRQPGDAALGQPDRPDLPPHHRGRRRISCSRSRRSVENTSETQTFACPYGIIARHGEPADLKKFFILHEGVVAMADGTLTETELFRHARSGRGSCRRRARRSRCRFRKTAGSALPTTTG